MKSKLSEVKRHIWSAGSALACVVGAMSLAACGATPEGGADETASVSSAVETIHDGIDVNGDNKNDLVFHNIRTGSSEVWFMNGATRTSAVTLDPSLNTTGWFAMAMADFNSDHTPDIFWHNGATGQSQVWYMSGTTRIGFANLNTNLNYTDNSGWRIVGSGDFNNDGKPDLFAHNGTSGQSQIWFMDGINRVSFQTLDASLNVLDSQSLWRFVGIGDFNNDGKADLFWHNGGTGESQVWYMNGATRIGFDNFAASLNVKDSSGWKFAMVTDLNNDGRPDLLGHNGTTGAWQLWIMNGIARTSFIDLDSSLNNTDIYTEIIPR